jgi:NADH-quinone oxidoreductase subunit L
VSEFLIANCWLVPFFPLLGAVIAAVGGRWLKEHASLPVIIGIGLAFLVSFALLFSAGPEAKTVVCNWIDAGSLHVPIELRVDGLTSMMLAMVTFVSTLVAIYATGYMAGDPGYPRFFAVVGLFVFSMTLLVLSGNYLLTYSGWEGVGVCSYLLVGFWHAKPSAAAAAKKAFLVNRVGDVGFAIAIFWIWTLSDHDLSYEHVLSLQNLHSLPAIAIPGIAFLLFWAATAKSAQLPLYVWLPDAMEGPTPVSALIHAATMVTAGVYLIARSMPLIAMAPGIQVLICVVGCATALLSASIALTQTDLKRVLAYSTVSQLGYMFMALGSGVGNVARFALVAGMFHLFTHAFFKACLFLASGSVMHSMGGVIDMRRFRGLRHRMPHTHITFAMAALALSGIFPFAGFFSKDEILLALKAASTWTGTVDGFQVGWVYLLVYWVAIITAFMTAFYTGRAYFWTFWGPEKLPSPDDPEAEPATADTGHGHGHDTGHGDGHDSHFGHESGRAMVIPLYILAACALVVGMIFGNWTGLFERHLEHSFGFEELYPLEHHIEAGLTPWIGLIAGLLGIGLSYFLYFQPNPRPAEIASRIKPLYEASLHKFWVDEFYDATVIRLTLLAAKLTEFLDIYLVDGLVNLVAWVPRAFGRELLAPFQNGLIQFYVAITALGLAGLFWILILS